MDVIEAYVDEIARAVQIRAPRSKWCSTRGNGTAGPVMHRLFETTELRSHRAVLRDGRTLSESSSRSDRARKSCSTCRTRCAPTRADLGIAFDGDADRIGAMDENGEVIYGDMLLLIYGREILTRKPGATFIGEVKCSQVLYDELKRLGGNPIMYKTGHSLIKAKMKEEHAELAGEMSGHMFFADRYFGYDDALYAACRLDGDRVEQRPAAFGAARRVAQDGFDAGNSRRLSG